MTVEQVFDTLNGLLEGLVVGVRLTITGRHYAAYLASGAWQRRRAKFLRRHGDFCRGCGVQDRSQVHHRTYERLGREQDADLVALCESCHAGVHALEAAGRTLEEATAAVVASEPTAERAAEPAVFVPLNRRPGYQTPHLGGSAGRLVGLPIVTPRTTHLLGRVPAS